MLLALLAGLCTLLFLYWLLAPRVVPWAEQLTRLNAGTGANAEWMAPPPVVDQVKEDYRAGQAWLIDCTANWGRFAQGLERYAAGPYLKHQRRLLAALVQQSQPRLAVRQTAEHHLSVRFFTSDGLRCLLIDRQTARRLTTSSYWTGRVLHKQWLGKTTLIYQMVYDLGDQRWKIERLIQELPPGTHGETVPGKKTRVRVSADVPAAAGRDS